MKRKKTPIKYKKERVVLSDILPFEIPIIFSNRYFYDFLVKNKIEICDGKIKWENNNTATNEIIKLIFGFIDQPTLLNIISINDHKSYFKTIPFCFKISHKENDFRELTVIHPVNQLLVIDFYNKYKQLILYYCNISPFSIRKPNRIAKYNYFKDKTHNESLSKSQETEQIEEDKKEYESLKTFFVYKDYSNIHKFYESYKFHRCEKKYNKLFKFDISKCFDSIYTHSISWAIFNKDIVKDSLGTKRSDSSSFAGQFDALMQNMNYGETNGIVIGPEFSRIFACLILQKIDRNVEINLRENESLIYKYDYEIFRYVDDYFVFYNDELTKEKILNSFRIELKVFKLYLNDSKSVSYEKPIVTEITIAKSKITNLLNNYLTYNIESKNINYSYSDETKMIESSENATIYVSSNRLITKFKTIIKETEISYKDILNYSLSVVDKKVLNILNTYASLEKNKNTEKSLTKALLEILDFVFFIYSVSPRVNTTIKLSRILVRITDFLKQKQNLNIDFSHLARKHIFDNISFILSKNKSIENTQLETLYLLIILKELGREYWLDSDTLRKYLVIEKNDSGELFYNGVLNYFTIISLLFYIRNKNCYADIRQFLQNHIEYKFKRVSKKNIGKDTELIFLLFDIITCPYLELSFKEEILSIYGINTTPLQHEIIHMRKYWFTKWTDFEFSKELYAKHSYEVY